LTGLVWPLGFNRRTGDFTVRIASCLFTVVLVFTVGCKSDERDQAAADAQKNDAGKKQPPVNQDGGQPGKKRPQSLLGAVYAKGDRVRLDNDLRNLNLAFIQYCGDFRNPNSRTPEGFLKSISGTHLHNAVKVEKTYSINLKARLDGDEIVAFETEMYVEGYSCIRANGQIGLVPEKELKAALGIP
jgi:hypothetical protein